MNTLINQTKRTTVKWALLMALGLLSAAPAMASETPSSVAGAKVVGADEVKKLLDAGVPVIDTRVATEYADKTIKGAKERALQGEECQGNQLRRVARPVRSDQAARWTRPRPWCSSAIPANAGRATRPRWWPPRLATARCTGSAVGSRNGAARACRRNRHLGHRTARHHRRQAMGRRLSVKGQLLMLAGLALLGILALAALSIGSNQVTQRALTSPVRRGHQVVGGHAAHREPPFGGALPCCRRTA